MTTIKAIVRSGRLEVNEPIDLPDGTELLISVPTLLPGVCDENWSDTPETIQAWLRWYDALEPVEFTPQERADWDAARREQKESELAQWEQRSQRVEGLFP